MIRQKNILHLTLGLVLQVLRKTGEQGFIMVENFNFEAHPPPHCGSSTIHTVFLGCTGIITAALYRKLFQCRNVR
jgi:hypothetical protein